MRFLVNILSAIAIALQPTAANCSKRENRTIRSRPPSAAWAQVALNSLADVWFRPIADIR
jgi:hypothetical protein